MKSKLVLVLSLLFSIQVYAKQMPKPDEDGFISTLNKTGWMSINPDPISLEFVEFVKDCSKPALDIGAAYGYIAKLALENGATIIINDID